MPGNIFWVSLKPCSQIEYGTSLWKVNKNEKRIDDVWVLKEAWEKRYEW